MKPIIFIMLLIPTVVGAGPLKPNLNATGPCRFGNKADTHTVIENKDKSVCADKICNHLVVCQEQYLKIVNCKPKNGLCTGYTAEECLANATSADAEFDTTAVP